VEIHKANGHRNLDQPCGAVGFSRSSVGMCLVEDVGTNHKPAMPNLGGGDETLYAFLSYCLS
jgi:hypothetical protein